jgi:hypothetical protein
MVNVLFVLDIVMSRTHGVDLNVVIDILSFDS